MLKNHTKKKLSHQTELKKVVGTHTCMHVRTHFSKAEYLCERSTRYIGKEETYVGEGRHRETPGVMHRFVGSVLFKMGAYYFWTFI